MRVTLHVVDSDEVPFFHQAFPFDFLECPTPPQFRGAGLLVGAGVCGEDGAEELLEDLHQRVLAVVAEKGPSTLRQMGNKVPELRAKIHHDVGKAYEGEFSIGSRLVGGMCARGLLVRARPRGTWRSSLYEYAVSSQYSGENGECRSDLLSDQAAVSKTALHLPRFIEKIQYAALSDWLPDIDLESVTREEAWAWLVRRYLAAFGPATLDDVQWWTGLTKAETMETLDAIRQDAVEVGIECLGGDYLMLADDAERLRDFVPPDTPYAFLLPTLDPYIMGYSDRSRFLAPKHRKKVFDRAGNAVPTAWVDGEVVGVWGQRKDGQVFYELFEPVGDAEPLLAEEVRWLEDFLGSEALPPGIRIPFTRALE